MHFTADAVGSDPLEQDGRYWFRRAISSAGLIAMDIGFESDGIPGRRWPLHYARSVVREVTMLARIVMPAAQPIRVVSFDKTASDNWQLGWHQDRVVALRERVETEGFTNWTCKDGIWHAEPPINLLQKILTVRVHLDAADEKSGALQLALGSHVIGKIPAADAEAVASRSSVETCTARRGDVLFMNALLLHRSGASQSADRRRAIRIDYCAEAPPEPLEWESAP